jgi:hypothetical protein
MVCYPFRYIVFLKFLLISALIRRRDASVWVDFAASRFRPLGLMAALSAALLLPGCAGDQSYAASRPTVVIGFIAGAPTPTIEVYARGRPLVSAVLVEPTGRVTPSGPVEQDIPMSTGYGYGPSVGVGVGSSSWNGGRATGAGVGIGMPLGGGYGGPPPPSELRLRTRIVVPDIADYRGNWERSVVRVTFGTDPANQEIADIPAPAPGGR